MAEIWAKPTLFYFGQSLNKNNMAKFKKTTANFSNKTANLRTIRQKSEDKCQIFKGILAKPKDNMAKP